MEPPIADAASWRYPVLISGESEPSAVAGNCAPSPFRRIQLLDTPFQLLEAFAGVIQKAGGEANLSVEHLADDEPTAGVEGHFVGSEAALFAVMADVQPAYGALASAVQWGMKSFTQGRPSSWTCRDRILDLWERPLIMGVVNLTPDSFSDGGRFLDPGRAAEAAWRMMEEGADILDIGGESTRPGSHSIPVEEELRRVEPFLQRLDGRFPLPLSIDTSRAVVARMALDHGASIINDITGLCADPKMLPLAVESGAGVVIMHMQGTPATMQEDPQYIDVVREVFLWLHRRVHACVESGVAPERIALDPGIGFGKTGEHNLSLLHHLRAFTSAGLPIVVGPSRKGFLGKILGLPVDDRVEGTVAACVAAVLHGASILRVHDVKPVARAIKVAEAIRSPGR